MERIYFDYASTTPVDPRVLEAMRPYFCEKFGNPSSPHTFGREANDALEHARETVAQFIGARPHEVVFNSGGTEGNNHAIFGVARGLKKRGNHIIASSIEHHSAHGPLEYLAGEGYKITYLPVDAQGLVDPEDVRKAIGKETILIVLMHANNEIGTIQPVAEVGRIAQEQQVPFLIDAVQTVGHILVDVGALGADLLTLSGHKFYGPKGAGALYIRQGLKVPSFLLGGDQERGRRASTQNVAGAVGLAKALELCRVHMDEEARVQSRWRDELLAEVPRRIEGVIVNGHPTRRLPNNAHFSFEGVDGESLLLSLDMAGVAASMGSACTSGAMEISAVLRAIGLSDDLARGALRISLGRWTRQEHIDLLLEHLPQMAVGLRI